MGSQQHDLNHYFDFVMKLTIDSAKVIREAIQGGKNIETKAGDWDLVTQYDRKVEEILISGLSKEFPTHKFIGEETVSTNNHLPELTNAPTWIIDPIDGTTNFVHSFPHTCISIALAINKELEIGIVYNPVLEQLFTARKGRGAFLNGKSIRSSSVEELANSLICIEASYATIEDIRDIILGRLEAFVSIAHGIRTLGSAALTLCHVAMGAAEAYHTDNLMPWDVAAGTLIIKEAGGCVIDTNGGNFEVMSPKVLAVGNRKLAQELVKLIKHADARTQQKRLRSIQA
ncbi:inositol monophosphatase 1-like [Neodiprion virginianus]|uniref:Inositol-1-monophosphatase n=1 Tax=Neodiprion lecontei TaxID=441921 RepID=A0A6J0BIX6_NEOLC|nr:inositol monophosphatase 1 [Neodiprion lecontei]XP_046417819.1 inositol monophosphatase 1-like [Neodiprion fabricii]XP_046611060.1 inositol monophosphatase 1-like [Neodiprion virginianus]